jgi:hypothetical protein
LLRISETALIAKKNNGLTARPWELLGAILPDSIGPLRAVSVPSGHFDRDGTKVSKATRDYASGTQVVKVEAMDAVEANGVLVAFMVQQAAAEPYRATNELSDGAPVTASLQIGPHPALARYTPASHQCVITAAVAHRFIIEVNVTPSIGIHEALAIARALPLGAFASLPNVTASGDEQLVGDSTSVERTVLRE